MSKFSAFWRLFLQILFVFLSAPAVVLGIENARGEYVSEAAGVRFTYPPSLHETRLPPSDQVLVRLASEHSYPTLNIVMEPGSYDAQKRPLEEQGRRVVESYRSVGITDAAPVERDRRRVAGRDSFHAVLRYSYQGRILRSGVTIVPGEHRHLIVTFIDDDNRYDSSREMENEVLDSLRITDKRAGSPSQRRAPLLSIAGIILAAAALLWVRRRRKAA